MHYARGSRATFFVAICFLTGCDKLPSEPGKFNSYRGTIFSAERAQEFTKQCSRDVPAPIDGTWMPTEAQVRALESPLVALVKKEASKGDLPGATIEVARYYRQYGGLIIGGKRIIYVNAFDEHLAEFSWRWQVPRVCDGGYGLFGVEYDPSAGTFANFSFNGSG